MDPKVTAELTKQTGQDDRLLTVSVQREDRADVTVNTRDISWNYDAGFNFQYPVIERYSISGSFDYNHADYSDQQLFTNLTTYTENLYLYYILNEQRDLFIDYRLRESDEATGDYDIDNSLSAGVSGRVVRALQRIAPGRLPDTDAHHGARQRQDLRRPDRQRRGDLEHEPPDDAHRQPVPGFLDNGDRPIHRIY